MRAADAALLNAPALARLILQTPPTSHRSSCTTPIGGSCGLPGRLRGGHGDDELATAAVLLPDAVISVHHHGRAEATEAALAAAGGGECEQAVASTHSARLAPGVCAPNCRVAASSSRRFSDRAQWTLRAQTASSCRSSRWYPAAGFRHARPSLTYVLVAAFHHRFWFVPAPSGPAFNKKKQNANRLICVKC